MSSDLSQQRDRFRENPDARAAFELLEEHYFLEEQWDELATLYRERLAAPSLAGDPDGRGRVLLRLGQLLEDRLGDEAGAIGAYRECASTGGQRRTACQRLRRLYAARGSWATVLQIAELEAPEIEEPAERARLLRKMGDIWRHELGDREQADHYYARAREVDGADGEPDAAGDPGGAGVSLVQEAWLLAARGESNAAVVALREALTADPSDIEAIDMLITVLDGAERHSEMADLLERRAALATDLETRAAVLTRLGAVREEQLGDLGGARSAFERALGADPTNAGARSALGRIYRVTHSWTELRTLLESALGDDEAGPEQRVAALCELGDLLGRQFDDHDTAVASFEEALALLPESRAALEGLARARAARASADAEPVEDAVDDGAGGENRAVRVVEVLERKLAGLASEGRELSEDAVKLRLRLAELRSATLDDPAGAIEILEPCLESDEALLDVAQRLARLYERAGRTEDLVSLARRAAALSVDPEERADWYRRGAERARESGDVDAAVDLYRRLLEQRPGDRRAQDALIGFHRSRGEAAPLVSLLRGELARATGRDELPLHLEIASLLEGSLDDCEGALAHWARALCLAPRRTEVLDRALHCADATGGPLRQLDVLDHAVAVAAEAADRAHLLARRGEVLADALGWSDEGVASWRLAVALDPGQAGARARLQGATPSA